MIAARGITPKPAARTAKSVIAAPSYHPLRRPHAADVIDHRKDEDDTEGAEHDCGNQGKHSWRERGWRTADNRDVAHHAVEMIATIIRPVARLFRREREHDAHAPGHIEVRRTRLAVVGCLISIVVDEPVVHDADRVVRD